MSASLTLRVASLCASIAFAVGCGPDFERIEFENRTTTPAGTEISYDGIRIPVGIAVTVIARPIADGERMDEDTEFLLESSDSSVIGVDPAIEDGSFVIYGAGPGTAEINVIVEGDLEPPIPVEVRLQKE